MFQSGKVFERGGRGPDMQDQPSQLIFEPDVVAEFCIANDNLGVGADDTGEFGDVLTALRGGAWDGDWRGAHCLVSIASKAISARARAIGSATPWRASSHAMRRAVKSATTESATALSD
ncbi:hypothetical protein D1O30_03230 [Methylocystis hirsuta]|uniref:Uncharacterized protein n=1 Tax=Methylocystis hirsuta TaxID=369798 RepID=A0A3M9XKH5_9HYPH|nr:hypothetical protein D1O30_03230 [Methylocystis hirsuta]